MPYSRRGKTPAVRAAVERATHGNLNICHGAGLVYQGTTESDLITSSHYYADCLIWLQSVCWKNALVAVG